MMMVIEKHVSNPKVVYGCGGTLDDMYSYVFLCSGDCLVAGTYRMD